MGAGVLRSCRLIVLLRGRVRLDFSWLHLALPLHAHLATLTVQCVYVVVWDARLLHLLFVANLLLNSFEALVDSADLVITFPLSVLAIFDACQRLKEVVRVDVVYNYSLTWGALVLTLPPSVTRRGLD